TLDPHPADAIVGLRALVAEAPASISLPERFLVRGLFAELAARLEHGARAGSRRLWRALLAVSPITPADTFRDELARLVDSCVETLGEASAPAKRPPRR